MASVRIGFDRPNDIFTPHAGVIVVKAPSEQAANMMVWAGQLFGMALEHVELPSGVRWVCELRDRAPLTEEELAEAREELDQLVDG